MNEPLPGRAAVVIVGGGIQGLCCAFYLTTFGVRDIVVLDAGYWQGGASGRNGTLIRPGFASVEWTRLFKLSCEEWGRLSARLGENVMFTPRGYTIVAERPETAEMLSRAAEVHRRLGVESFLVPDSRLKSLLPDINHKRVAAALHQPAGGVAPHHAAMKGLLSACRRRGVQVRYRTAVTGFERSGDRIATALVGDHRIEAGAVVVAAGAHNPAIAALLGVSLDGYGMRIEAMALEPIRPMIGPAIALIDSLAYFHQTARGEIVGGTEVPERPRMSLRVDLPVMAAMAKIYLEMFPRLAEVRILRHWAGTLHVSLDFAPLLGPHPDVRDLWFSAGWSYGFAGAPAAGLLLAKAIATGEIDARMKPFALDRFARGRPIVESGIVLSKNQDEAGGAAGRVT
ncbi:MAG: FAD-dependent oxidoreductase [Rhodospirillaceae bacterium]|nr:FAD-dependent oxidoreductase [Rhodospirillaceae bacterium]